MVKSAAVCLAALLFGGCFPLVYVHVPALKGRVLGQDGRPVQNAIVQVVNEDHREVERVPVAPDGTFETKEISDIGVNPIFGDLADLPLQVRAMTTGDRERSSDPATLYTSTREIWDQPVVRDIGELRVR
jgi:hypothetical protein